MLRKLTKALMTDRLTPSATLPRARNVSVFAIVPLGQAAIRTRPIASAAGRRRSHAMPKASSGNSR